MNNIEGCGVEVSARELVVARKGKAGVQLRRFANTAAGHRQLLRTLTRGVQRVRVVLEATGLYELDLALLLSADKQVQLMVANPRAVRHFAQAMMQRSKNDQLDAVVLLEFAERMPFTPWVRPPENALALWAIARRLQALTKLCTAEKNRAHANGPFGSELRHGPPRHRPHPAISPAGPREAAPTSPGVPRCGRAVATTLSTAAQRAGLGRHQCGANPGGAAAAARGSRCATVGSVCRSGSPGVQFGDFRAQAHADQQGGQRSFATRFVHAGTGG